MQPFAKVYSSIFTGSLRGHSDEILVFVNLLTHSTQEGVADIHPNVISDETGLSIDRVTEALHALESPDPESRSPDEGGKRIILLDSHRSWGWFIVNHEFYRSLSSDNRYRESTKERVRRFRERKKGLNSGNVTEALQTLPFVSVSVLGTEGVKGETWCNVTHPQPHKQPNGENGNHSIDAFQEFWNFYPRKVSMFDAQHAWVEVGAARVSAQIMSALRWQVVSDEWKKEGGKFIPSPSNYLRGGRWNDQPTATKKTCF